MYRRRRGRNTLPVVREARARTVAGILTILYTLYVVMTAQYRHGGCLCRV